MPKETFFQVNIKKDICSLSEDRAVECFRRLLWAEASSRNIGKQLIDVPDCINAGDGGLDAYIDNAKPIGNGIIPQGTSGYQIKITNLSQKEIIKELHVAGKPQNPLKPEITKLLNKNGCYILVVFKELSKTMRSARETALRKEFRRLKFRTASFKIISANQIASEIEQYPALVSFLKNDTMHCQCYSVWGKNSSVTSPKTFITDSKREAITKDIQAALFNNINQNTIIRISGLSGIGKTRFLYETLSPLTIQNRVIYIWAEQLKASSIFYHLLAHDTLSAIIVVDECDLSTHQDLVKIFNTNNPNLSLITVSYDFGKIPPPTKYYEVEALPKEKIEQILSTEYPEMPKNVAERIRDFADGYPLIAILLARGFDKNKDNPNEFYELNDSVLINRLLGGAPPFTDEVFVKTKKVMTGLSLFSKVGAKDSAERELVWLSAFLGVDIKEMKNVVGTQKRRGTIQGAYYLYVRPFMLRAELFKDWWQTQGFSGKDFDTFILSVPEAFRDDLATRFFEQIHFIANVENGKEFINQILSGRGIFRDSESIKNKLSSIFFLS